MEKLSFSAASAILFVWVTNGVILPHDFVVIAAHFFQLLTYWQMAMNS
jgi:hypothetical protein